MTRQNIINEDIERIAMGLGDDAKKLSGKTILMSGGAGFLGKYFQGVFAYLNKNVLEKPCKVIALDNYITSNSNNSDFNFVDGVNIIETRADVTKPLNIDEHIDFIIHAAGLASPVYYRKYPLETIDAAILGARNLLDLARKTKPESFLFFSSSEIYGDPDSNAVPTKESYFGHVSSIGPRACYDESKRLAETISVVYFQQFGVPIKIVRPFNVYGPGMNAKDYRVMPTFAVKAFSKEILPVHGNGKQTRTYCYITDAITGFIKVLLLGRPGEAYNIGNDKPEISVMDLAKIYKEIIPDVTYDAINYPEDYPGGEPQRRCPDLEKSKKELNYTSSVTLIEGVKRFLEWASQHPDYIKK